MIQTCHRVARSRRSVQVLAVGRRDSVGHRHMSEPSVGCGSGLASQRHIRRHRIETGLEYPPSGIAVLRQRSRIEVCCLSCYGIYLIYIVAVLRQIVDHLPYLFVSCLFLRIDLHGEDCLHAVAYELLRHLSSGFAHSLCHLPCDFSCGSLVEAFSVVHLHGSGELLQSELLLLEYQLLYRIERVSHVRYAEALRSREVVHGAPALQRYSS